MSSNFRCRHPDCIYRNPVLSNENTHSFQNACNYASITGKTRLGQLPPNMRDPAKCPFYESGKRIKAPLVFGAKPGRKPEPRDWEPKALELYRSGHNDQEIAALLNINAQAVGLFRKRKNLPRMKRTYARFNFDQAKARVLYQAGKSDKEIADAVGVHRGTIGKWRDENNLPCNVNVFIPVSHLDWDKALRMYEEGRTDKEIAAALGCSGQYIGKWRKKNKLPSKQTTKGKKHV
ncbi:MAG: helix-turn-helix domain-containing protein [Oscillospiraceae bacterium]|nr:helix-turn-helix domain-containing protein [Oscillospiraceae bacterium]